MTRNRMTGLIPAVLAVAGLLLAACQPAVAQQPTPQADPEAQAVASVAVSAALTDSPVPQISSAGPSPEPYPTPATVPTMEPLPTPEGTAGIAYDIRSIEEISAGSAPQVVDITDVDAVLVFESSIPLACSIVYGMTPDYGLISVDQDMNGGARTDHHPLLVGLEPDTDYHYRVQGTAADGTLYLGESGMFRTLPAEEKAEVNLASVEAGARVAAVSSNFGGAANDQAWGAESAIDSQRGTAWSSNGDGDSAFIEIELAQTTQVKAVEVWTRSMSDGTAQTLSFTLTTDSGQFMGPYALDDAGQAYRFDVDALAHTLRLDVVDSTGGNTGLVEFAVFGTPVGD